MSEFTVLTSKQHARVIASLEKINAVLVELHGQFSDEVEPAKRKTARKVKTKADADQRIDPPMTGKVKRGRPSKAVVAATPEI